MGSSLTRYSQVFAAFFFVIAIADDAYAEGYFRIGGSYMSSKVESSSSTSDSSRLLIDIGAGYIAEKGWSLGGLYSLESSDSDPKAYGLTGGWISRSENGFYALGTYFIKASDSSYSSGWGYQADLGYRIALRRVLIAPQISYKKYTYDVDTTGDETISISHIDPMVVMWVDF